MDFNATRYQVLRDGKPVGDTWFKEHLAVLWACKQSARDGMDYSVVTSRGYPVAYIIMGKRVSL